MTIETEDQLRATVWETVHKLPVFDIHTHLYDARFGELLLWGIDELLSYHYLVAETFRGCPKTAEGACLTPEDFFALSKSEQGDIVWQTLFVEQSPLSESTRGVLTTLGLLGQDPGTRDLQAYRRYFRARSVEEHIDEVMRIANLEAVVMTNDPFDELERPVWEEGGEGDPRFKAALRLDGLLIHWRENHPRLKAWGYNVKKGLDKNVYAELQRFLNDWIDRMRPLYLAVSLPPSFDPWDKSDASKIIEKAVLPVCRERNLPFAMMIGVKKLTNPALRLAGDSVGKADIDVLEELCAAYPENKFLVTMLSRENQHELCVAARKFANLMPFGCWWFLNDPMTIDEMTRMRLELLGASFIPQHSDARVLDQLLYKWAHSRWLIAHVLIDKYCDLHRTGWRVGAEEIERDVRNLFGENFKRFVGLA